MESGTRNNKEPAARRGPRPAFSFVEVLFAVMILGIGFIMLAGIFPVAIGQTQATGEEANAANIARAAVAYLEKLPGTALLMTPDGQVRRLAANPLPPPIPPPLPLPPEYDGDANDNGTADDIEMWHLIKGNVIWAEDPRYAWVPLYRRWTRRNPIGPPPTIANDFAEVTILVLRVRNKSEFAAHAGTGGDLAVDNNGRGPLMPRRVTVFLEEGYGAGDILAITEDHTLAPGAMVLITGGADRHGRPAAGRMYRIGNAVDEGSRNRYYLSPTQDMLALPGNDKRLGPAPATNTDDLTEETDPGRGLTAWIVGEGTDPATGALFGGAQDVAVYTSFIKLNP